MEVCRSALGAFALAFLLLAGSPSAAAVRFLHQPSVRGDTVAFVYQGEIWTVDRNGGTARQLTSDGASKSGPLLSPDGRLLAYTARAGSQSDVFMVDAKGGTPRRLTFHPATDTAAAWSMDGSRLLVTSNRAHPFAQPELFEVSTNGGPLRPHRLGKIHRAAMSPDGAMVAHTSVADPEIWKRYRGGRTPSILVTRLSDGAAVAKVPHERANDTNPIWVGSSLYLLSDRAGTFGAYRFEPARQELKPIVVSPSFDLNWLAADDRGLVFSSGGYLYTSDLEGRNIRRLKVMLSPPAIRNEVLDVANSIQTMSLAGDGRTLAIEARGDIFVKPEAGPAFNLTRSPGAADRMPAWSPVESRLAYVSDGKGRYDIVVQNAERGAPPRVLGGGPLGYPFNLTWSPDGRHIAYIARDLAVWSVEVGTGRHRRTSSRAFPGTPIEWARDSSGIIYLERLASGYGQLSFAKLASGSIVPLTESTGHVRDFRLSSDGKTLFLLASTSAGPMASDYDVSSLLFHQTIHGLVYQLPSPDAATERGSTPVAIPESAARYPFGQFTQPSLGRTLFTGDDGALAVYQRTGFEPSFGMQGSGPTATLVGTSIVPSHALVAMPNRPGEAARLASFAPGAETRAGAAIDAFLVGAVGRHSARQGAYLLVYQGKPFVMSLQADGTVSLEALSVGALLTEIRPVAERRQMFEETARLLAQYLHDPDMNGLDWNAITKRYRAWLPDVRTTSDFYEVLTNLAAETSTSHVWIAPPPPPSEHGIETAGLLGADFDYRDGRPVVTRILPGSPWDIERSPLAGSGVAEGDVLVAIDGKPLAAGDDVDGHLVAKAGKPLALTFVGSGGGTRSVTVTPLDSERTLRMRTWIEDRRRHVDERSGGTLAYLHQPDTLDRGLREFIRYFYAQANRQGLIVDDRFNTGGADPDYQLDVMGRTPFLLYRPRDMAAFGAPNSIIAGPKVLLVNAESQSGGDVYPVQFKARGLGHVIGTPTWGGVDGYYRSVFYRDSVPGTLVDGGQLAVPDLATLDTNGNRIVENIGFQPDEVVEIAPADHRAGRDPQLDRAIDFLMTKIRAGATGSADNSTGKGANPLMLDAAASAACVPSKALSPREELGVVSAFMQESVDGRSEQAQRRLAANAPYVDYSSQRNTTALETLREIAAMKEPPRIEFLKQTQSPGVVAAKLRFGSGTQAIDAITVFRLQGSCIAGIYAF